MLKVSVSELELVSKEQSRLLIGSNIAAINRIPLIIIISIHQIPRQLNYWLLLLSLASQRNAQLLVGVHEQIPNYLRRYFFDASR